MLGPTVVAGPSEATNWFGATGEFGTCPQDLAPHYGNRADIDPTSFYHYDLAATTNNDANWVRQWRVEPTDVDPVYDFSLDWATDVVAFDNYYVDYCGLDWASGPDDGGTVGLTVCESANSSNQCESAEVRFNLNWLDGKSLDTRHHIVCHEFGHALGLKHPGADGEMVGLGCVSSFSGKDDYTSHDKWHLSYAY